ncbi:MAG: GGDEF-domain containing protein, partial [Actinobacteria bacterium]
MTSEGGAVPPPDRAPAAPTAVRHRMLATATVLILAVGVIGGGLLLTGSPPASPLSPLAQFGAAAGLIALAHLARFRVRIGADTISVTWTEAALIVGLYLAPAGWLPAATFLGAGVAWTLLSLFTERRTPMEVVRIAAGFTIAVAAGAAVTRALTDPRDVAPTPALAGAATAGALAYVAVGAVLAALALSLHRHVPFWGTVWRIVQRKALMVVGNVLVGLVAVVMIADDPQWLLFLPAALWLLQQTYGLRLLADDERRAWQEFARATGALNQLDERAVATAGVAGALAFFGADQVEVDVLRADGRRRRYTADRNGVLRQEDAPAATSRIGDDEQTLTRTLTVGDAQVGELRVRLPRSALPGPRERSALNAYGDALGAALHDAATHEALLVATARSSYEKLHDPLTRLVNRSAMLSRGDSTLRGLPPEHPVALILLDLNDFREVNDVLGPAAGDELLRATAERLAALVRPGELLGRLGGDEFALLATTLPVT